ncbi:MAG: hypothetical protein MJH10_15120, partial [Epibacterium sp.]|nr:hypothetical protein [Epibacterium sp.]
HLGDVDSNKLGTSFSRGDRSFDGRLLFMPEALLFYGRLRAAGVNEFTSVEEDALAWHRSEIKAGTMSYHDRRSPYPMGHEKIEPGEEFLQAYPITTYLRYLVECRDDVTQEECQGLVDLLEEHGRFVTEGAYAPAVTGVEPRQAGGPGAATFSSAQYAVFDLMKRGKFDISGGPKAKELIHAILAVQEPDTGLIDHRGRDMLGYDPGAIERMRSDQHPFVGLKALALIELQRSLPLLQDN